MRQVQPLKKKKSQTIELSSLKRIPASWIIVLCGSREIKIQYNKVFRQRLYVLDSNYNNCQVSEKFSCNYERVWSFEMFYIWILKNKWARLFKSSRRIIVTSILLLFFFIFCLFVFLGPRPWHLEVPGLGVELELQLPAYARATATEDPSCVCDLHHGSQQCWLLNPQSKARDRTHILMDLVGFINCWATMGTLQFYLLLQLCFSNFGAHLGHLGSLLKI